MTGIVHAEQTIAEALETSTIQLVSSDGNEATLASQQLQANLQEQGFEVQAAKPDNTCACFNAQVADLQVSAPPTPADSMQPKPALEDNFSLS